MLLFELAVAIVFLLLSAGVCWMAWALPVGLAPTFWVSSGAFPFILGVILFLLSAWWAVDLLGRIRRDKLDNSQEKKASWLDELLGDKTQKLHFVIISVAVLLYVFVLIPVLGGVSREYGFVLASFIFLCVTIKLFNNISILKTVAISASSVLVIYVVFHYGLKVMMPT